MKKYVIVRPNCRKLENHLWNYLQIYAYGIATSVPVYNPSFFEWHRYFDLQKKEFFMTKVLSAFSALAPVWHTLLSSWGSYLIRARAACTRLTISEITFLPPTRPLIVPMNECNTTYFVGWLFRNPRGLEQHRSEIVSAFRPNERIGTHVETALAPLSGKTLIGVHLRQQPYPGFEDDSFLVPPMRVRRIIEEYIREKNLNVHDVALVVASDKKIDSAAFDGFITYVQYGNDVTSLFLLSKCNVVIGSNSTFSNLAAWFGNIPHIVTRNEPIDWAYYAGTSAYFENKYATFAE